MSKKHFSFVIVALLIMKINVLLAPLFFVKVVFAALQIQESCAERFSFTWQTGDPVIDDTSADASTISFDGHNIELGDSGQPIIPALSLYVGIPARGSVRVSLRPTRTRTIILKRPLKVSTAKKRNERYKDLRFRDPWLSEARPTVLGDISARQFILKPLWYDEKTKTVTVLEKAGCVMEFSPSGATSLASVPATDYSRMVSRLMLNYEVASKWKIPATKLTKRKSGEEFPLAPNQPMISFTVGDGHEGLNEGTIKENGIIKIPGDWLQKLGTYVPVNRIALLGSYKGEMPTATPDISSLPDGVTEIPLMRFDMDSDGIVDPEDYVLAYVTGSSDWAWNRERQEYFYNLNRYEDYRHFWITMRTKASTINRTALPAETPEKKLFSFGNHVLCKASEEISHMTGNVERKEKSGLDWRWKLLSLSGPVFSFQALLPGVDTEAAGQIRIFHNGLQTIEASFSGATLCTACTPSKWYPVDFSGDNVLKITGKNMRLITDFVEIKSFEFKYEATLDLSRNNNSLTIFSPETGTTVAYHLSNLPAELVYIIRIDADENPTLVDSLRPGKGSSYEWIDSAGKGIKYYICAQSAIHPTPTLRLQIPQSGDATMVYSVRAADNPSANKADYLIVSHPDFLEQAQRLAKHKQSVGRFSSPKVVDVNDVYREFSGGNLDPAGIRNFLIYAHTQWGVKPEYVVLLGKGHYNFKSIGKIAPVFVPVSENNEKCVEDFFSYLDSGETVENSSSTPDLFIGRLPCVTIDQARQMVDKIIDLEDPSIADYGAWRNRGLLVNDDNKQIADGHVIPDDLTIQHRDASDDVGATILSMRPSVDIRKVNLFQYPLNSLLQKPEARDALVNDINSGLSFVNFFGHGSPALWTDEQIFDLATAAKLHNDKHYPLIASFSCAVGEFDQPADRCLSEALALASKSGAIATISCTRAAFSNENRKLAVALYKNIFDSSFAGATLGQAYAEAKMIVHDENSQLYSYLGDPSIRFADPLHRVSVEVLDKAGRLLDTLMALQAITMRGSILKKDRTIPDADYGSRDKPAYVQISLFNPPVVMRRDSTGADAIPGTPIFTGEIEVINGRFEQTLHLPRNILFKKTGAKITAFSWQGPDNGIGYKPIILYGTDSIGSNDTNGPTVALRPMYDDQDAATASTFISTTPLVTGKLQATLPFKCQVNVFDSSGIDVAGTGPDEGLSLEIEGALSKQNINHKFRFDGGDYRKGNATIEFGEGKLHAGTYSLWISAQDLAGNVTRQQFVLELSENQDIAIINVFNYPNPVKMGQSTGIYYQLSKSAGVKSSVKIYSMSGKLLRVFRDFRSGQAFNCRDEAGSALGPNVYLYQVIAEDSYYQKTVKSKIQKLLIHPPR